VPEIPKRVRDQIKMIPVDHMDDVLKYALSLEDPEAFFKAAAEKFHVKPLDGKVDESPLAVPVVTNPGTATTQ
jgi:predicted ATP-dependent protease